MIRSATESPRLQNDEQGHDVDKRKNRIAAPRLKASCRSPRPKKRPFCIYRGATGRRNTQWANNICKKLRFESPFSPWRVCLTARAPRASLSGIRRSTGFFWTGGVKPQMRNRLFLIWERQTRIRNDLGADPRAWPGWVRRRVDRSSENDASSSATRKSLLLTGKSEMLASKSLFLTSKSEMLTSKSLFLIADVEPRNCR